MRIKVELHRDVVWFLRQRCTDGEVDAFYDMLERLRTEPIANSEAVADPQLSRYMLRFCRFKQNLAIFRYDASRDRIRVLECRRRQPKRRQSGAPDGQTPQA